jgi:hypothetical protein
MLASGPIVDSLTAVPFFAGLDADALQRVAAGMRSRRFRRGEVIFHVGDPGDALFIIVTGEVKIWLPSEAGGGHPRPAAPGDVFGEPRPARRRPTVRDRDRTERGRDRRAAAGPVPRADLNEPAVRDVRCWRHWPWSCDG